MFETYKRRIAMNDKQNIIYDVTVGVILICGLALMIAIPYELENLSVMTKVWFGMGVVEGLLVSAYGRFFGAVIIDYLQSRKNKDDTL